MTGSELRPAEVCWNEVSVLLSGRTVVDRVSLDAGANSWTAIIGPNGAGKTTLLRALVGTVEYQGTILVGGDESKSIRTRDRARRIAFVPQHPVVPPGLRVFDYILLGRSPYQGLRLAASADDRNRTVEVLDRLHLSSLADRSVDSLSGGERQRAVVARSLAQDAPILVLDEPTTFLDLGHQLELLELVAGLREEHGLTVITTLHDLSVVGHFADHIAVTDAGRLVAEGPVAEVLVPNVIARHWNVEAQTEVHDDGSVSVSVQRRRRD